MLNDIKILTRDEIMDALKKSKNGTFITVGYKTEPPLKAEFKKKGYKVVKLTECRARLGVNYNNINSVKNSKEAKAAAGVPTKTVKDNYKWVIENKLAYNTETKQEYLRIATAAESQTKHAYIVFNDKGMIVNKDYKDIVLPSYFNSSKQNLLSPVRNIKISNIIRIGNVGEKF